MTARSTRALHRLVATSTLVVAGLGVSLAPAHADTAPGDTPPTGTTVSSCEQEHQDASDAQDAEDTARKAYTSRAGMSVQAQAAALKKAEAKQATDAAKQAADAAKKAAKLKGAKGPQAAEAKAAAKAAAAKARAEKKQADQVRRASHKALVKLVQADRAQLKSAWDQATKVAEDSQQKSDDCDAQENEDEAGDAPSTPGSTGDDQGSMDD